LEFVAEKNDQEYYASAVGEVNVVAKMKEVGAAIGGEGNGGIILPDLHYGRDALVGIALFLTQLAHSGKSCSELRASYPDYFMAKKKVELKDGEDVDAIISRIEAKYQDQKLNKEDGLKIEFEHEWVHLRKSNTEPIIRIYTESQTAEKAEALADKIIREILAS
jgi:phosphomannomutase